MNLSKVEQVLNEAIQRGIPGCECHITLGGKLIFSKSLGVTSY